MGRINFAIEVEKLLHDATPEYYTTSSISWASLSQLEMQVFDQFKREEIALAKNKGFKLGLESWLNTDEEKKAFESYIQSRVQYYQSMPTRNLLKFGFIIAVIIIIFMLLK